MINSASQYLFTYIYCQQSCRLLEQKETWFKALKFIGVISFIIQTALLIYCSATTIVYEKKDIYQSCTTFYWFALNCSQMLILFFFCCVGVQILRSIHNYAPISDLARKLHDKHKKNYTNQLKTCIFTIVTVIVISNFYTTSLYFGERNKIYSSCTKITQSWTLNQMIWIVDRSLVYCLWVIPFIWMFWQELQKIKLKMTLALLNPIIS